MGEMIPVVVTNNYETKAKVFLCEITAAQNLLERIYSNMVNKSNYLNLNNTYIEPGYAHVDDGLIQTEIFIGDICKIEDEYKEVVV